MDMDINGPIERDIPFPSRSMRGPKPKYIIEDMEIGDSRKFAAPSKRLRATLYPRAKALGFTLRSAKEGDGTRVWRVA